MVHARRALFRYHQHMYCTYRSQLLRLGCPQAELTHPDCIDAGARNPNIKPRGKTENLGNLNDAAPPPGTLSLSRAPVVLL